MAEFVDTIQERPLDKLMAELPALAELSTTKFSLARQTFRRRVRTLERVDYEQLRVIAFEVADDAGSEVGERIRSLFALA
jgi:hypothetical protein